MVNAASSAYLARHGVPQSREDLHAQGHRIVHYSRTLGARPHGWEYRDSDGGYATLPLPGASHVNSVQAYEAASLACLGLVAVFARRSSPNQNNGATVRLCSKTEMECMSADPTAFASVFFSGLLAGEELAIRFGVRGPLARLETRPHIEMRQGLIRTLRVLVPIILAAALLSGLGALAAHWDGRGRTLRLCSVGLLAAFILLTLFGTVPINKAAGAWVASAPPSDWRVMIRRWERLDSARTVLALGGFALALAAL